MAFIVWAVTNHGTLNRPISSWWAGALICPRLAELVATSERWSMIHTLSLATSQHREQLDKLSILILGMTIITGINQLISRFGGMLIRHHRPTTKQTQPCNRKTRPFTKQMRLNTSTVCGKSNATISHQLVLIGPRTGFRYQWWIGLIKMETTYQTVLIKTLKLVCTSALS